jgi:hypothetical protein
MTMRNALALVASLALAGTVLGQNGSGPPPEARQGTGPQLGAPVALPLQAGPSFGTDGEPLAPVPCDGGDCGGPRRWVSGDYLLGWVGAAHLPPLVSTSIPGTARANAGVVGTPGSQVIFGNAEVDDDVRSGGRLGVGYWLDCKRCYAIEAGGMILEDQSLPFRATSDGTTILARPFIDAGTGNAIAALIAFPGLSSGSVFADYRSHAFYSGNLDLVERLCGLPCFRLDVMAGYRFLHYGDDLYVTSLLMPTTAPFVRGTQIRSSDGFSAVNDFHGAEIGMRANFNVDRFTLELLGKVALGRIDRDIEVTGQTVTSVPGAATRTAAGGLLALSSNIGTFPVNSTIFAPELGATLGWQVNPWLRLRLGYWAVYWAQVARAGDQVDLVINQGLIPQSGVASAAVTRPVTLLHLDDLWVQGISLGAEIRY